MALSLSQPPSQANTTSMGCTESTEHEDVLERSEESTGTQATVDIDTSTILSGKSSKPIGFSRVAESRRRRQQQDDGDSVLGRDSVPPLAHREDRNGNTSAAIAPPNPMNPRSRTLVFDADSTVSPIHSGNSVFSSDGPPAADQQTVAYTDDVLSQTSFASSAPVLSSHNSHSEAPEFSSNVDGKWQSSH